MAEIYLGSEFEAQIPNTRKMMNLKKLVFSFGVFALAIASAASSYKIELTSPISVGETKLKAGNYDVQVEADKVVFKTGKTSVEVPAVIEKSATKFKESKVSSADSQLKEIQIGGTTTKILFGGPAASGTTAAGGSK